MIREYKERIKKAHQAVERLNTIWRSWNISVNIKIKVYKTMVKPILIRRENWYIKKASNSSFLVLQNKLLRRILNVLWQDTIRNDTVCNITKVKPIKILIKHFRWWWLGYIFRRVDNTALEAVFWEGNGRRPRGRPREP